MELLIFLLIAAIILGALLGGKNFGDTVSKGCGCLVLLIAIAAMIGIVLLSLPDDTKDQNNNQDYSTNGAPAYFIVKYDCQTFTRPDIKSDVSGFIEAGKVLNVRDVDKFNYFYEITDEYAKTSYVRKECLKQK